MPKETIIVLSAIVAGFVLFMGVMLWADLTSKPLRSSSEKEADQE
jgi:hypothetical protein